MDIAQYGLISSQLEFIAKKEREGNLIYQTATRQTAGEIVAYTPASGKTFFLIMMAMVPNSNGSSEVTGEALRDGTRLDYLSFNYSGAQTTSQVMKVHSFGLKLVGNGSKKMSVDLLTNSGNLHVRGIILGWIEDT